MKKLFLAGVLTLSLVLPAAAGDAAITAAQAANNLNNWANGRVQNAAGAGLDLAAMFDMANDNGNARLAAAQANVETAMANFLVSLMQLENLNRRIQGLRQGHAQLMVLALNDSGSVDMFSEAYHQAGVVATLLGHAQQQVAIAEANAKKAADALGHALDNLNRIERGSLGSDDGDERGGNGPINPGASPGSAGSGSCGPGTGSCNPGCGPMR
ncbi:MAG: hypothetical protein AMXMBFR33_58710 [Candidatus Xenobia bacterium]